MRTALLVLGLVVMPRPASSQDVKPQGLKLPTIVFAGAAGTDWVTTYRNVTRGGSEANPLLSPLRSKPKGMVALGAGMDIAGVLAWNHFIGRRHPRLAAVGLYVAAAARAYIAYRNNQRLNEHLRGER